MEKIQSRKTDVASLVTSLAVGVCILLWVAYFGPSWPVRDSFAYLILMDGIRNGHYTIIDFLTLRNNEHFVAFQYLVAAITLWIFNFRTKILLIENALLLLTGGWLILRALRRSNVAANFPILLPLAVMLPLLNLSQVNYLLWEFQIFWYLGFALFAASIFLIEKFKFSAYPAVFLLCILATGCEAQGVFLWISSGLHLLMVGASERKGEWPSKKAVLIFIGHTLIFLSMAFLLLHGSHSQASMPNGDSLALRLTQYVVYYLKILGGGFGIKIEKWALVLGSISLLSWMALLCYSLSRFRTEADSRIAILLSSTPILWIAAFAVGREKYGAPWALSEFHASPMLVPFYVGMTIFALMSLSSCRKLLSKIAALSLMAFALAPIATSVAFGYAYSQDARLTSMLAEAASCNRDDYSPYLLLHLNGLDGHEGLYAATLPYADKMCASQTANPEAIRLLATPPQFAEFKPSDERDRRALRALWEVYLTHADLRRAMTPTDPDLAKKLLTFAYLDAKTGSGYDQSTLGPYADVFLKLQSR
jgi:hypothetical protein